MEIWNFPLKQIKIRHGGIIMSNKANVIKIFSLFLALGLVAFSRLSYADWSVGIGVGDRHDGGWDHRDEHNPYRWHDHPQYGWHSHFLPAGCFSIWVDGARYYYYDGLYYAYVGAGDYVLVNPPLGAYVSAIPPDFQPVLINGRTYYTDNGVYYVLTHHGYKVVSAPVVYAQPVQVIEAPPQQVVVTQPVVTQPVVNPESSFTVNVPNNSGGYSAVVITRSGSGYTGPQGEYYATFPTVSQLKAMYAK